MPKPKKIELNVVKLPADLTARVDVWAAEHAVNRPEAIQQLVELGLKPEADTRSVSQADAVAIEHLVSLQLDQLIDPGTPEGERERRIHRLTDGPPEFVDFRIDLPGRRPN